MTLERWKLLAGVFGIAIVGLVAMANPQCPGKPDATREKAPTSREVQAKPFDAPKTVAVAIPAPEKTAPPIYPIALPDPTPRIPELEPIALPKVEVKLPTLSPSPPATSLPVPIKTDHVIELPLPGVPSVQPVAPVPELKLELPKFEPTPPRAELAPLPAPPSVKADRVEKPATLPPAPFVPATPELPGGTIPPIPATIVPIDTTTSVKGGSGSPVPTTVSLKDEVEMRVRVVVPLAKGQSKFEVLSGDTTLLQAACEQVEVRSPTAKTGAASPIKASGKVRFTAPGCEGTCDSLTVLPTTGEVELSGSVRVHCKQGKAETEIQAATMKFKLGSDPSMVIPAGSSKTPSY